MSKLIKNIFVALLLSCSLSLLTYRGVLADFGQLLIDDSISNSKTIVRNKRNVQSLFHWAIENSNIAELSENAKRDLGSSSIRDKQFLDKFLSGETQDKNEDLSSSPDVVPLSEENATSKGSGSGTEPQVSGSGVDLLEEDPESMIAILQDLEEFVEQIDNANGLRFTGGLSLLSSLLSHEAADVAAVAAAVVRAAASNNAVFQGHVAASAPEVFEKLLKMSVSGSLSSVVNAKGIPPPTASIVDVTADVAADVTAGVDVAERSSENVGSSPNEHQSGIEIFPSSSSSSLSYSSSPSSVSAVLARRRAAVRALSALSTLTGVAEGGGDDVLAKQGGVASLLQILAVPLDSANPGSTLGPRSDEGFDGSLHGERGGSSSLAIQNVPDLGKVELKAFNLLIDLGLRRPDLVDVGKQEVTERLIRAAAFLLNVLPNGPEQELVISGVSAICNSAKEAGNRGVDRTCEPADAEVRDEPITAAAPSDDAAAVTRHRQTAPPRLLVEALDRIIRRYKSPDPRTCGGDETPKAAGVCPAAPVEAETAPILKLGEEQLEEDDSPPPLLPPPLSPSLSPEEGEEEFEEREEEFEESDRMYETYLADLASTVRQSVALIYGVV